MSHFMLNYSKYAIIKTFKINFGGIRDKYCLKQNELAESALKQANCCDKDIKEVKNTDNKAII